MLAAALLGAWLAGCTGETGTGGPAPAATGERTPPAPAASPAPTVQPSGPFPAGMVRLLPASGDEPVPLAVHVAADPPTRRRGLMHRGEVPPGTGMLFAWPEDNTGAFWMKDTLVPLSIAFADADGRILRVLDMEPCEADPCPSYDPGVSYRGTLEVNQGFFDEVGLDEEWRIELPTGLEAVG